ncbi:MAG: hypothetical protein V3R81_04765, partial [Gammaproteobacteria bacterium]
MWKPQAASTHDSYNASALGAFSESAGKARGGGSANINWIWFKVLRSFQAWFVTLWVDGDQTPFFTRITVFESGISRSFLTNNGRNSAVFDSSTTLVK